MANILGVLHVLPFISLAFPFISSAKANELFKRVDHFVGLALKGLKRRGRVYSGYLFFQFTKSGKKIKQ